jgi:hypothetical protein
VSQPGNPEIPECHLQPRTAPGQQFGRDNTLDCQVPQCGFAGVAVCEESRRGLIGQTQALFSLGSERGAQVWKRQKEVLPHQTN